MPVPGLLRVVFLSACDKKEEPPSAAPPMVQGASVRIGVVPALTVTETIKQYQPVVDYLNKKLNINGQLMPQKDYLTVLEMLRRGEFDAGIFGSLICYLAIREIGALPLARPEIGGDSSYEGLVFADEAMYAAKNSGGNRFSYANKR